MSKKNRNPNKFKTELTNQIIKLFQAHPTSVFNYKQIATKLQLKESSDRTLVSLILQELEVWDMLKMTERGKYKLIASSKNSAANEVTGRIDFTPRGAAYLIVDGQEEDIYIHRTNTGKAFNQDIVKVQLTSHGGKTEGKVIEVIERAKTEFVGTIDIGPKTVFVRPDDPKMPIDFFIEKGHTKGAKNGEKVTVKFLSWPGGSKSPLGGVTERIGMPGTMDVDMNSILVEYGFPTHFPGSVEQEAHSITEPDYEKEATNRRDFRDILTFTIDPVDAKDFDDALSFRELDNGNYEIGVHIADVSHYVLPGTHLDTEALGRGNSVYLVDRVIPMLPENLSNLLCSLRPNETKLTFSAVFEITPKGKLIHEWFGKTLINSDKRFTYEEAQEIIEGTVIDNDFGPVILLMDKIAKMYRKERLKEGALNVESQEVRFDLDEQGNPLGIKLKISKDANKLIEEFMLLANKRVAMYIGKPEQGKKIVPFVYRLHDEPNEEKIADLRIFLNEFGYKINLVADKPISFALNTVMEEAKKKDELHIIGPMVIRAMSKAYYGTDNIGHYGLAFPFYTHFTSPIRRYADLLVHRILFERLNNKEYRFNNTLDSQCKHISNTEKLATDAERASVKYMQVKFMADKVGLTFEAKITGVTDWGIFVEMDENKCEGLVHIKSIEGNYQYNGRTKQLESRSVALKYHLGMKVDVVVKNVDLIKKQIDLELAEKWD
jgi:ribonuclease R